MLPAGAAASAVRATAAAAASGRPRVSRSNSTARSRSISAVSRLAFENDSVASTPRRNCTLVATPTMWVCASAASSRASASSRVAPCTISLAIIES